MGVNIILLVVGLAFFALGAAIKIKSEKDGIGLMPVGSFLLGVISLALCFSVVVIPTGYTGVKITFGQVDDVVVPQGFSLKIPFVQNVSRVNNKQQEIVIAEKDVYIESTIEGKIPIKISKVGVTYQINADKASYIYKTVSDPSNLISFDLISSAVKSATSSFNADSVVVRTSVEPAVLEQLQSKIDSKYGEGVATVVQVTLDNISFSGEYDAAIDNKNIAKQEAEKQEIINQKNIDQANAEANALLIAANAEKEANALKRQSLDGQILQQQIVEKWDGVLPKVVGESGTIFDIGSLIGEE